MPRVYIASLSDYNAGVLHGVWLDVTDKETMLEQIAEMLADSPTAKKEGLPAEEWAIHDCEGFGDCTVAEHEDLDTLCAFAELVEEHGNPFLAWVQNETHLNTDKDAFLEAYRGEFDSLADYVEDWWTELGFKAEDKHWWHPTHYVNWEKMANDLRYNGEAWTAPAPNGKVYVFSRR